MPYVDYATKEALKDYPDCDILGVGELTYMLTIVCKHYMDSEAPKTYAKHAEVIAALENTKLEFYRRIVAPYEDDKIRANGDVW
jgi:hypothetical protein